MMNRKRTLLPLLLCLGLAPTLLAQDWKDLLEERPEFPEISLIEEMEESREDRVARIRGWEEEHQAWVAEVAEARGLPLVIDNENEEVDPDEDGTSEAPVAAETMELVDFDEEGNPEYRGTHNTNAAITTHARNLRDGPLSLDGSNEIAAMWESGTPLLTHQEFQVEGGRTRVTNMDGTRVKDHATHVAGTIGAAGVDPAARGMAPFVSIFSWGSGNNLSEMSNAAPSSTSGANAFSSPSVSNHSYGYYRGWIWDPIDSDDEDAGKAWHWHATLDTDLHEAYGQYDERARRWDSFAHKFPDHLALRSSGNERTGNPSDGDIVYYFNSAGAKVSTTFNSKVHPPGDGDRKSGFDTIPSDSGAKNVLTVGNFTDGVRSDFRDETRPRSNRSSSWGPMDDGRIKPDVVANGTQLYSPISTGDADYDSFSGTSMATPNTTGTAVLLQQRRRQYLPEERFNAAELKGLLIHSADDILNTGPDYRSGWGLVNAVSAIYIMDNALFNHDGFLFASDSVSMEGGDGAEQTYEISVESNDPVDLKATLVWVDPPGQAQRGTDNKTPALVHDLDLRLINEDQEEFEPFILDPDNPADVAVTGDNTVDNVEQVIIRDVPNGVYTVKITNKGNGALPTQDFALWVSPIPDPLALKKERIEVTAESHFVVQRIRTTGDWSIASLPSWIEATPRSGSGDERINLHINPNFDPLVREATLRIEAPDRRGAVEFLVKQEGYTPSGPLTIAEAVDQPTLSFTTSSGAEWTGQDLLSSPDGGGDATISPIIGDDEETWLKLEVEGPGVVNFDYFSESEDGYDYFYFLINGSFGVTQTGMGHGWQEAAFSLDEGTNVLEWRYDKDESGSEGMDRALVDNLVFHRLTPDRSVVTAGVEQALETIQVQGPTTDEWDWATRNVPHWLDLYDGTRRQDDDLEIDIAAHYGSSPRTGTFEIGSNALGWWEIEVNQPARTGITTAEDALNLPDADVTQTGTSGTFVGVEGAGVLGTDTLVAENLGAGNARIEVTIEGPGILAFSQKAGLSSNDYFNFSINGEWNDRPARTNTGPDLVWTNYSRYLPEGSNTVVWHYTSDGIANSFLDAALVSNIRFLPVKLSHSTFGDLPVEGQTINFEISQLDPAVSWRIEPESGHLLRETINGTGAAQFTWQLPPNSSIRTEYLQLNLFVGDMPRLDIDGQQPAANEVPLDEALDNPGLIVAKESGSFNNDERVAGQDVVHRDGVDAVVLGHENDFSRILTDITGPAAVTFDYRVDLHPDDFGTFELRLDGVSNLEETAATAGWQSYSFSVPENETYTVRWESTNDALAFIDNLRIESPLSSEPMQARTLIGAGGELNLPLNNPPSNPLATSSSWLTASISGGNLKITSPALPGGTNARSGWVRVDGQRLGILQIRPAVVEAAYLNAVGAANVDEALLDQKKHPLGDLNQNGTPNAVEWVLNTLGSGPEVNPLSVEPSPSGGLRLEFGHRQSDWAELALKLGSDLASWSTLTYSTGEWQPDDSSSVTEISHTADSDVTSTYILDLLPADSSGERVFLFGEVRFR